jgi:hypothetical protein
MHHVRIDTSLADTSQLEDELLALEPDARGITAVSSEQGLELLAAAAQETMGGLSVGINWIGEGDTLAGRFTQESNAGPDGFSPNFYSSNAFNWNYLNLASPQRIGVTEAWYMLDRAGKLNNKVKIAILDMGFGVTGNQDLPAGWVASSNVPFNGATDTSNLLGCGGGSCPWHGTNVAGAAFGVANNAYGGAGPGGPVAAPVLIYTLYDYVTSIGAVVQALARGARIINMSYSARVPAVVSWTVLPFEATTAAASLRAVIFASAGNDGANVDAEDCFFACWEEAWHTPCENAGVICVGGLARSSTSRASGSNYGAEQVDLFAPYTLIVGPDPGVDETRSINGTSFSSPFAAGVAALIWAANPSLSAGQVRSILLDNARTSPDPSVGLYINAAAAVGSALGAVINITAPIHASAFSAGRLLTFEAFVAQGDRFNPVVTWSSNINGTLGTGTRIQRSDLSVGVHSIRARVTFSNGSFLDDTITLTIVNDPPVLSMTSPANGSSFFEGQPITLSVFSFDANRPLSFTLQNSEISWSANGAFLGTGHNRLIAPNTLAPGAYTISVTGSDGVLSDTESVSITVMPNPPDLPPDVVTIHSPANGFTDWANGFDENGSYLEVTLVGSGHDPEDGDLTGVSLEWSTLRGGVTRALGTGSPLVARLYTSCAAPGGTNQVTLAAVDSAGNRTTTNITVFVNILCK